MLKRYSLKDGTMVEDEKGRYVEQADATSRIIDADRRAANLLVANGKLVMSIEQGQTRERNLEIELLKHEGVSLALQKIKQGLLLLEAAVNHKEGNQCVIHADESSLVIDLVENSVTERISSSKNVLQLISSIKGI